jgi:diguanylate cyclase (GGDEF)-like protein/PAS domain S-box-containing protein
MAFFAIADKWPERAALGGVKLRLVGIILLVALPLIAVLGSTILEDRARNIEAAHTKALDIARDGGKRYRSAIVGMRNLLETLSLVSDVVSGSPQVCAAFLERAAKKLSWAAQSWVMDPDGRVICSTVESAVGASRADRDYFKKVMATREFVVSDFIRSSATGNPTTVATLPVLDDNGAVTRVLAASVRLGWFSTLFAEVAGQTGASVILFDGQEVMLARYPYRSEWIGKSWRGTPLIDRMGGRSEGSGEIVGVEGVEKIVGWAAVPGTQAHIAVGFDRATVLEGVNGKTRREVALLLAAAMAAVVAGIALARGVVRPLRLLTEGAKAVRNSPEASLPQISGYAEVTSLAASLDALLTDRRQRELALLEARAVAERAEKQARDAHAYLTNVIDMLPEGVVIFDAEDRFYLWNRRFAEHYSGDREFEQGERFEDRLRAAAASGLHPPAVGREEAWVAERLARHAMPESSYEQLIAGDRWIHVIERRIADGTRIGVRSDITELKRREEESRLLFDSNPVPMWVHDAETGRILAVNDAAIGLYGYGRDQFLSMSTRDFHLTEHDARASASWQNGSSRERHWRHLKAGGTTIDVTSYSQKLKYAARAARLVAIVDVTERKRAEARITHMAHHDDLTGLANRVLFRERLEAAAGNARTHSVGVLYIDLDDFKDVNDALGHPVGDQLLRAVAGRLGARVRPQDMVARLGGDEFAVIQDGIAGPDEAEALAARLIEALGEPYDIDGRVVTSAVSIGIAVAPRDGEDTESLLKYADLALYSAKADGGRAFRLFAPEMNVRLQARRNLERDLREAVARDGLELHYQPSINLASGCTGGFEALLRWNHPGRGAISPAEFIPIAEDIGLIDQLGEWVLRRACNDAAAWPSDVRVAVNLSPLQFQSRNLVHTVLLALASSGLPAQRLELEITESVLLQENESNLATLHQLRALGARIALDDFGIGYSSMSYLRMFPFDRIKIDRSFVMALPDNRECVKIVHAMVELAKSLDMDTTAEGIETAEQFTHLATLGCTEGQGYLFSPARPVRDVPDMLTAQRAA